MLIFGHFFQKKGEIFSVNKTKSPGNCGFGHICWRNNGKLHFLCSGYFNPFLHNVEKLSFSDIKHSEENFVGL